MALRGTQARQITVTVVGDSNSLSKALNQAAVDAGKFEAKMETFSKSLGKVAVPLAGMGAVATKVFGDFDAAMVKSIAIMDDVDTAMRERLEEGAREVAKTTIFSASQAAEAYRELASAGLSTEDTLRALPGVAAFAQAGMFDLATATGLLTDAQTALGLSIQGNTERNIANLIRVSDVLVAADNVAATTVEEISNAITNKAGSALRGMNKEIEEGVAVLAAFAAQGVKGQEAGEKLSVILRDTSRAAAINRDEFARLGIEVFDAEGNFRHLADVIADFERVLGPMSDEQRAVTFDALGLTRSVGDAIRQLFGLSGEIRTYEAELRRAGGTTQQVAEGQMESFQAQLGLAKDQLIDAAIVLGEDLAPAILNMTELLGDAAQAWSELPDPVRGAAADLIVFTTAAWGASKAFIAIRTGAATVTKWAGAAATAIGGLAAGGLALAAVGTYMLTRDHENAEPYYREELDPHLDHVAAVHGLTADLTEEQRLAAQAIADYARLRSEADRAEQVGALGSSSRQRHAMRVDQTRAFLEQATATEVATARTEELDAALATLSDRYSTDLAQAARGWLDIFTEAPELEATSIGQLQANTEARIDQINRWADGLQRLQDADLGNLEQYFRDGGIGQLATLEGVIADLDAGGAAALTLDETIGKGETEIERWTAAMGEQLAEAKAPLLTEFQEAGHDLAEAIAKGFSEAKITLILSASSSVAASGRLRTADGGGRGPQFREFGGRVWPGEAFIVGERRAEVFVPDVPGTIHPDASTYLGKRAGGYASGPAALNVNINVDARGATDPDKVAYAVRREFNREQRIFDAGATRRP